MPNFLLLCNALILLRLQSWILAILPKNSLILSHQKGGGGQKHSHTNSFLRLNRPVRDNPSPQSPEAVQKVLSCHSCACRNLNEINRLGDSRLRGNDSRRLLFRQPRALGDEFKKPAFPSHTPVYLKSGHFVSLTLFWV